VDGFCHSGSAGSPDARPRPDAPYGTPDAGWLPDAPYGTPDAYAKPDVYVVIPTPDATPSYTWKYVDRNVTSSAETTSTVPTGPCTTPGAEQWITIATAPGGTRWYFTSKSGIYYYTDPQGLVQDCASGAQWTMTVQYTESYSDNPIPPFWSGLENTTTSGQCDTGQIYISDFYFCR
jgi:hypothetical protein